MCENERAITTILKLRLSSGMSQKEVSKGVGMKQSNYARLESGRHKITVSKLCYILDFFGVEIVYKKKDSV